ncbi:hypothetical protein ACHHV8_08695 [Paenibacillus sp. TAB 01]
MWVEGLKESLKQCYEQWSLPSENGISWAQAGRIVDLSDYSIYQG